jgi:hypothetical protein
MPQVNSWSLKGGRSILLLVRCGPLSSRLTVRLQQHPILDYDAVVAECKRRGMMANYHRGCIPSTFSEKGKVRSLREAVCGVCRLVEKRTSCLRRHARAKRYLRISQRRVPRLSYRSHRQSADEIMDVEQTTASAIAAKLAPCFTVFNVLSNRAVD